MGQVSTFNDENLINNKFLTWWSVHFI